MQIDTLTVSFEVGNLVSRLEGKQNNTVKLTLNELPCGCLGEPLFIFPDSPQQVCLPV